MISIYTLSDPRTMAVRYVGRSKNPTVRHAGHCSSDAAWIKELKSLGLTPIMRVVELVSDADANDKEVEWIKHYKASGCDLVNKCHLKAPDVKTVIGIERDLHLSAKIYAAANKTTLAALVNEGLASLLARKQAKTGNPLRIRKGEPV